MSASIKTEFEISTGHLPGQLAELLERLAEAGVNVIGFCGRGDADRGYLLFVPDDPEKARAALAGHFTIKSERPVIAITAASGRGAGHKIAARLAKAKINIDHAYATTWDVGPSTAVFAVPDPDAALKALK